MSAEEKTETREAARHRLEAESIQKEATTYAIRAAVATGVVAFVFALALCMAAVVASGVGGIIVNIMFSLTGILLSAAYHVAANYFKYKGAMFDLNLLTRND